MATNGAAAGKSVRLGLHPVGRVFLQTKTLLRKNLWVLFRNRRALYVQLSAPILMIVFLKLIAVVIDNDNRGANSLERITHQDAEAIAAIPRCITSDDVSYAINGGACITVAYAPNSTVTHSVMERLRTSSGLPPQEIRAFQNESEMITFILDHPNVTQSAILFNENYTDPTATTPNQRGLFFNVFANITLTNNEQFQLFNPYLYSVVPLVRAALEAILRETTGQNALTFDISRIPFPQPSAEQTSVIGDIGPIFFFGAAMFAFVVQIGSIVQEKEQGLRETMGAMGLNNVAFWLSWYLTSVIAGLITSMAIVVAGLAFGFPFFSKNAFGLYFFLFWLFSFAMSGFTMFCAVFLRHSSAATSTGFIVFLFSMVLIIAVQNGFPFETNDIEIEGHNAAIDFQRLLALIPSTLFAKGLQDLGEYSRSDESTGLSWSQRGGTSPAAAVGQRNPYAVHCVGDTNLGSCDRWPLESLYKWFVAESFLYLLVAWYLDEVLSNETGVRKHPLFFIMPWWKRWRNRDKVPESATEVAAREARKALQVAPPPVSRDQDVAAEESRAIGDDPDNSMAVRLFHLKRRFQQRFLGLIPTGSPFEAVKGVSFGIERGTIFALLGPNGAGKTTTFKMLSGVLPPSDGDATVLGHSIRHELDKIRGHMGLCPQFDVQWNELTGTEHLRLFCLLKAPHWTPAQVEQEVAKRLEQVGLTAFGDDATGTYSGGMRRRLSVAIALCTDPDIVYMDEPTTGMDPVSRRQVWTIIQQAKENRVVVLTTHSMEEADTLGDRLAIIVRGELQCIGSSLRLKNKFGTGYRVTVRLDEGANADTITGFVTQHMSTAVLDHSGVHETAEFITYRIPRDESANLPKLLRALESSKAALCVSNVQLAQTTLEEVFLRIVQDSRRAQGAENAPATASAGTPQTSS